MPVGKLNAQQVKNAKPGKKGLGKLCDGGGLWLYTGPNSKSWVFRYMMNGRAKEMGLGSFDTLGLAQAREKARQCRLLVHRKPEDGGPLDPLHERQSAEISQKIDRVKAVTFEYCAEQYLKANRESWK